MTSYLMRKMSSDASTVASLFTPGKKCGGEEDLSSKIDIKGTESFLFSNSGDNNFEMAIIEKA